MPNPPALKLYDLHKIGSPTPEDKLKELGVLFDSRFFRRLPGNPRPWSKVFFKDNKEVACFVEDVSWLMILGTPRTWHDKFGDYLVPIPDKNDHQTSQDR